MGVDLRREPGHWLRKQERKWRAGVYLVIATCVVLTVVLAVLPFTKAISGWASVLASGLLLVGLVLLRKVGSRVMEQAVRYMKGHAGEVEVGASSKHY